jgi:hypothetical protein
VPGRESFSEDRANRGRSEKKERPCPASRASDLTNPVSLSKNPTRTPVPHRRTSTILRTRRDMAHRGDGYSRKTARPSAGQSPTPPALTHHGRIKASCDTDGCAGESFNVPPALHVLLHGMLLIRFQPTGSAIHALRVLRT